MNALRFIPALAALLILEGTTFERTPTLLPARSLAEVGETSPVHRAPPSRGPVVVNVKFSKGAGFSNLIINPDGTYLFSGKWNVAKPTRDFEFTLAVRNSLGGVVLFHYVGSIWHGGVQWSKQGQSAILKDNFKTFAGKITWGWSYRFPLDAVARKEQAAAAKARRDQQEDACAYDAQQGILAYLGYVKFCSQFNSAW